MTKKKTLSPRETFWHHGQLFPKITFLEKRFPLRKNVFHWKIVKNHKRSTIFKRKKKLRVKERCVVISMSCWTVWISETFERFWKMTMFVKRMIYFNKEFGIYSEINKYVFIDKNKWEQQTSRVRDQMSLISMILIRYSSSSSISQLLKSFQTFRRK